MAIVLTEKFAEKIDERYYPTSVSAYGTNQNYDWDGAQTIKVTSIGTTAMGDYNRSTGYGTVASADELSNTVQTLTLSKDRFFRAKLDKMDENESKIKSGEVLGRELREVTIPEIEAYRFNVMCANILANTANGTEITATDSPYADFLEANAYLDDLDVPDTTKIAFATPKWLGEIKKDSNFVKASEMGQKIVIKGQVGEIDGVAIVKVKAKWLATTLGTQAYDCIIVDKNATVAPMKLMEYSANANHPDFSGTVFQGRFYYDAFVLEQKKLGLVGIKIAE